MKLNIRKINLLFNDLEKDLNEFKELVELTEEEEIDEEEYSSEVKRIENSIEEIENEALLW